jgi:hypothetical protein
MGINKSEVAFALIIGIGLGVGLSLVNHKTIMETAGLCLVFGVIFIVVTKLFSLIKL